ncbi:MAG: T9SS type A sorting domain-containing protein [Bacteroidales bacterium]|nr:T9SS type A sorting domain-containing protein [Bacteroidales bacterium]
MKNRWLTFSAWILMVFILNTSIDAQRSLSNNAIFTKSDKTNMEWIEMGPSNQGGRTRAMLIDKDNPNLLYAGAIAGGLWKSTLGGSSWTKVANTDNLDNIAISCLYQSPNGDLYFGTGEYFGLPNNLGLQGKGIWKSTDNGSTWNYLNSTNDEAFKYVTKITGTANKLYVATYKGLRISTDGGQTWSNPIPNTDSNFDQPATDVEVSSDGSLVVASINNKAYVCNTGDDNFVLKSDANNIPTDVIRLEFAIAPTNINHVYCLAVNNEGKLKNIYESVDKGNTWMAILDNVTSQFQPFGTSKNQQGKYHCALAVSPTNDSIIYIGGVDLYRYHPNTSFEQLTVYALPTYSSSYVHQNIFDIKFSPNYATDNTIYVATDGGLFKSTTNGTTWAGINKNLNIGFFNSMGLYPNNQVIGGTQHNGFLYNNLMGTTSYDFQKLLNGVCGNIEVSSFNPECMIATTTYGTLYRTSDGGTDITNTGVSDSILSQNLGTYKEPFLAPLRVFENFYDTNSVQMLEIIAGKDLHIGDTVFATNGFGKNIYHIVSAADLNGNTVIPKGDTLYTKDTYTSLVALGLNNRVWISWEALNPSKIPPAWYPATYSSSIKRVQTLEFSNDGDNIYFADYDSATAVSKVYRLSNIQAARTRALANCSLSTCVVTRQLLGTFNGKVSAIAVDPQNKNNLIVVLSDYNTNPHIYYSTVAATTTDDTTSHNFVEKQGNLEAMPVYTAIILWNNSQQVILGTEKGIYVTEDITATSPSWVEQNNGMAKVPVAQLRQQLHRNGWLPVNGLLGNGIQTGIENHGVIYAATKGRGIFRCETFRGPVSVPENTYIENNSILNIYPNPAVEYVTVSFNQSQKSNVEINIMTLNGQNVYTKQVKNANKGEQNIELPIASLASGVYMVTVKNADGKYIGKLIKK